jgi:hypothetical protein
LPGIGQAFANRESKIGKQVMANIRFPANNFDRFPVGDAILKDKTLFISASWNNFMESFYQNLISYLSPAGIFLPNLTQAQINAILVQSLPQQSPVNGQFIYNTDIGTDAPQFYQVSTGMWRTLLFT